MVELRSNTHLHFIRAIKDGSIKPLMNVVSRDKSKLRIKTLVDVYNQENIKNDESISRIQPQVVRDLEKVSEMTKDSCLFGSEEFNMTLKKIRKQCKVKKRKLRSLKDTEIVSQVKVKQESLTLLEDEGCVLEEPLSMWKTKLSKKRKRKQKHKTKRSSSTSSPPVFCDVKLESCEAMDFISSDPLPDCNKEQESPTNTELMEDVMCDSSKDTRLALYYNTELSSHGNVAIEEPIITKRVDEAFTHEPEEFNDATADNIALQNQECVLQGSVFREETEFEIPENPESEIVSCVPISTNTSSGCKPVREDEENNDPSVDMNITGLESVKIEAPEILAIEYSSLPTMDFEVENTEFEKIEAPEILAIEYSGLPTMDFEVENTNFEKIESSEILTIEYSGLPTMDFEVENTDFKKIEAPEILAIDYSGLPTMGFEVENTEIVWETKEIAKDDDLPEATDIIKLANCCHSPVNLHSVADGSAISLERLQEQPASSENVDEAGNHKSSQLYKISDEDATDAETESIQQQRLHNQPEKLLSQRKALSPTSQAKLIKAMENPDSPEKRSKKSKGKLYFSSQNSHRILKAQGLDKINRVEFIPNSKQAIQKANKTTRQTQIQRATHKFSRRDTQATTKPQPFSSGSASLQGCTQKAITFSQGQMRDFQFVAAKLTEEIKSMRQITKRCLLDDNNTSNISECNFDEVKTLIKNAERTEESSKKWLSIIERDCNRFCKLMGLVTEDSPAIENIVQKKKKIKFADDAGGDLCHIKVFEADLESEL